MKPIEEMTPAERFEADLKYSTPGKIIEVSDEQMEVILRSTPPAVVSGPQPPHTHRRLTLTVDVFDSQDNLLQPYVAHILQMWLLRSAMTETTEMQDTIPPQFFQSTPAVRIELHVTHDDLTEEYNRGLRDGREEGQRAQRGQAHEEVQDQR